MKNKENFSFNDFLIANTTKPWLIFNDIEEISIKDSHQEFVSNLENLIEEEKTIEEEFDLLDFKISMIESIFENYLLDLFDAQTKSKFYSFSSYEKIDFLKEFLLNNENSSKYLFNEDIIKNIKYLFSIFDSLELVSSGLNKTQEFGIEYLIKFYKETYKLNDNEIKFISLKQSLENKVAETKKALLENYSLIINPVFSYQNCYAKVLFLDTKKGYFGNLNYSNKTKKKNLLKAYFDFNIISKFIDIKEIFILKPKYQKQRFIKKNIIEFMLTKYSAISRLGYNVTKEKRQTLSENEVNALYVSNPNFDYSSSNIKKDNLTILEHIKSELVFANYDFNDKKLPENEDKKNSNYTCSFNEFLYLIKNREKIVIDWSLTDDDFIDNFNANSWFNKIIIKNYPNYKFGSKKILKAVCGFNKNIDYITFKKIKEFYDNNLISINPNIENLFEYKIINDNNAKIAWFDFEGVTLPYPIIDYVPIWNQIVSQTSIVKTINNKIYQSNDFVYDPTAYNLDMFKKVVDDLYDHQIDYYIIYNQGYEKSRLNEIKEILYIYLRNNEICNEDYLDYCNKIDFITNKLVDLCNLFIGRSTKVFIRDRIINLGEINGSSSIKKIEYFVTKNNLYKKLENSITPYANLNVKNGSAALLIATTRAFKIIGDNEWQKKVIDLKKYCHNDVMAMLMTADLIKYLMKNKDEYFNNWTQFDC